MKLVALGTILWLAAGLIAQGGPSANRIENVPIRGAASIPVHVYERPGATSVILAYPGGAGFVKPQLDANGLPVRLVAPFMAAGHEVLLVDVPSDVNGLNGYRRSDGHREDLRAVLHYARSRGHQRIWLLGHSRGTVSVARTPLLPPDEAPSGVILVSSVFGFDGEDLWSVPIREVTGPVLFVHNRKDGCANTLFEGLAPVVKAATKAHPVDVREFDHRPLFGFGCPPGSAHHFYGIEDQVAAAIVAWIQTNGG